jgi:hypothetical protein
MTCGGVGIGYFAKELHKKIRRARNLKTNWQKGTSWPALDCMGRRVI